MRAGPYPAELGPEQALVNGEGALAPQVDGVQRFELKLDLKEGALNFFREEAPGLCEHPPVAA
jgi:hypothetical protein